MDNSVKVSCPDCGAHLATEIVSSVSSESQMKFTLHPTPGDLLDINTIGGTLKEMSALMNALSKAHGTSSTCVMNGVRMLDDNGIEVSFLVLRPKKAKRSRPTPDHTAG
jgi:hypothetical protein